MTEASDLRGGCKGIRGAEHEAKVVAVKELTAWYTYKHIRKPESLILGEWGAGASDVEMVSKHESR